MNYKIGDKVSLVDQCAQAYVLQILSNGLIRIELDDDFKTELTVKPSQLAPYKDLSAYNTAKIKPKENKFQKSEALHLTSRRGLAHQRLYLPCGCRAFTLWICVCVQRYK